MYIYFFSESFRDFWGQGFREKRNQGNVIVSSFFPGLRVEFLFNCFGYIASIGRETRVPKFTVTVSRRW